MALNIASLTKEVIFPVVRAIPEKRIFTFLQRLFRFLTYRRRWELMKDYAIWSETLKAFIIVPKTFIFDGASVPKLFHNLLGPTGLLLLGACPHDFGYRYGGLIVYYPNLRHVSFKLFMKHDLDKVLQELSARESSVPFTAWVAKIAVKMFGRRNYSNVNGVDRVNKDFPTFLQRYSEAIND